MSCFYYSYDWKYILRLSQTGKAGCEGVQFPRCGLGSILVKVGYVTVLTTPKVPLIFGSVVAGGSRSPDPEEVARGEFQLPLACQSLLAQQPIANL